MRRLVLLSTLFVIARTSVAAATPTVTLDPGVELTTRDTTPTLAWSVSADTASVTCKLDNAAIACGATSITSPALTDGNHVLAVTALDSAGIPGTTSSFTILVDTVAPTTTIPGAPVNPHVFSTIRPTVFFQINRGGGSPIAAATCRLTQAGRILASAAVCDSSFTSPVDLADGGYELEITVSDTAGNVSTSLPFAFKVDTATLAIEIFGAAATSDPKPTTSFTVNDGATTTCRIHATDNSFDLGPVSCASPFTVPSALADNLYELTVVASNGTSATGTATHAFIVDTAAPVVTLSGSNPALVATTTPTFAFTAPAGSTEAPVTVSCQIDDGPLAPCTSPFTVAVPLTEGAHQLVVVGRDDAGNVGAQATQTFTIDSVAPVITISGSAISASPVFQLSVAAGGSPTTFACVIRQGGTTVETDASCSSPFHPAALADGTYVLVVTATDQAGNAASAPLTFVVDSTAPAVTISGPTTTVDAMPAFTFVTDGTSATCAFDSDPAVACVDRFTPLSALSVGAHTLTVTAADAAGNHGAATLAFAIQAPAAPPLETELVASDTSGASASFTFAASVTDATFECNVDNAGFAACTSPLALATLAEGEHTFAVRAVDAAGDKDATPATHAWTVALPDDGGCSSGGGASALFLGALGLALRARRRP